MFAGPEGEEGVRASGGGGRCCFAVGHLFFTCCRVPVFVSGLQRGGGGGGGGRDVYTAMVD